MMKPWGDDCKAFVKHMSEGDFFASEQSHIMPAAGNVKITFTGADGSSKVLKEGLALEKDELISGSFISASSLRNYFEESFQECADKNLLLSMHLKATMMKISDPIIFGHAVEVFYKDVFAKHGATFEKLGVNVNNGLGDVYEKIESLDAGLKAEIEADLMACYKTSTRPAVSMVDSRAGITNFHVPSDVIIDASMPNVVRDGGKMWNVDDELEETMALVPDRCYAGIYREALDYCRKHGQFDVATMGNVANVGLMAKKAEEYGSHDKTFEMESAGTVSVTDASGAEIFSYAVGKGDVWRMSQTKNDAIEDWVKLAVNRARATGDPAVFWLNPARAHDTNLINLCNGYLKDHDTNGLDIRFMTPEDGINMAMERCTAGTNTITVTGNVLRDYLTDLFPILELGTSAKMLSIVPLLNGGALYETGAGGSAPKHVQQLVKENHLRWDSLGEYLALAVSLEDLADRAGHVKAGILGKALNQSIGNVLNKGKSPSRKVGEIDNRGSSFYLALYWAEALTEQTEDLELAAQFQGLHKDLTDNEEQIAKDLIDNQGGHAELGGYYKPNRELTTAIMRPSATLNAIIDARE
jgi:isocitrate dehydrogenase